MLVPTIALRTTLGAPSRVWYFLSASASFRWATAYSEAVVIHFDSSSLTSAGAWPGLVPFPDGAPAVMKIWELFWVGFCYCGVCLPHQIRNRGSDVTNNFGCRDSQTDTFSVCWLGDWSVHYLGKVISETS